MFISIDSDSIIMTGFVLKIDQVRNYHHQNKFLSLSIVTLLHDLHRYHIDRKMFAYCRWFFFASFLNSQLHPLIDNEAKTHFQWSINQFNVTKSMSVFV